MGRPPNSVECTLDYVPPLDWEFFLEYLARRATPGVETIEQGRYIRTIEIDGRIGILTLTHHRTRSRLHLNIRGAVARDVDAVVARTRALFDLDTDLSRIHEVLGQDPWLGALVNASPGIRVPGAWSAFELLVRTIVGQQVAVKAATTLMGRIARRFGEDMSADASEGEPTLLFPTPSAIAVGNLEAIGMPSKRVAALQNVAQAIADATIPFPAAAGPVSGVRDALLQLPGIGPWTVEYFALRGLREPDAWPATDLVLRRAIASRGSSSTSESPPLSDRWRPYRGYAAMHLWNQASRDRTP